MIFVFKFTHHSKTPVKIKPLKWFVARKRTINMCTFYTLVAAVVRKNQMII